MQELDSAADEMSERESARVLLARHCKTRWNLEGRLQGTRDLPLCDAGRAEARALLPSLDDYRFDRIVCSPYKRAVETAAIFAEHLGIPLSTHPDLRELDHGLWEGAVIAELLESPSSGYAQWLRDATTVAIPAGEDLVAAQSRIARAVAGIANIHAGETVLVVTHKHIRAALTCALKGIGLGEFGAQIDESVAPVEVTSDQLVRLFDFVGLRRE